MCKVSAGDRIGNRLVMAVYPDGTAFVRCDCGSAKCASEQALMSKKSRGVCASCAARKRSQGGHGGSYTPEYSVWRSMVERTGNPNHKRFKDYGARQIHTHPRYRDGENGKCGFSCFIADVGPRPKVGRWTIERIDNSKGYEPGNLEWASYKDQARNRRNNVHVILGGVRMTAIAAAERMGLSWPTLKYRLKTMTPDQAATIPLGKRGASLAKRMNEGDAHAA